jgi:hypothetical protein
MPDETATEVVDAQKPIGAVHIGSCDCFTGRMLVADPCYANDRSSGDPDALALRIKVRPGAYDAYAMIFRYPHSYDLVSQLFIAVRDATIPAGRRIDWSDPVGRVGIDTGRLGFYDESRYPKLAQDHDALYNRTLSNTTVDDNLGVVSTTGRGDGSYDVFPCRFNGEVVGLLAWFLESDDLNEAGVIKEFQRFVPFLGPRREGEPMHADVAPPVGSLASYTTRLAWNKFLELRVNSIEVAELNVKTMAAAGREPNHRDVERERANLAAAMRYLRGELLDELGMDDEQIDQRYGALSAAIEAYLTAARDLFFLAIMDIPDAQVEAVPELERLKRVERAYRADNRLDMTILCLFNPAMKLGGEAPTPAPVDWRDDPDVIPLRQRK